MCLNAQKYSKFSNDFKSVTQKMTSDKEYQAFEDLKIFSQKVENGRKLDNVAFS